VKGILADINVQGQVVLLGQLLEGDYWRELWSSLELSVFFFTDVGLPRSASDASVWQVCQEQALALITANRNDEAPDSLEAMIRERNTENCLPVFTLADPEEIRHSRDYADRVVARLLGYLLEIDRYRGVGRLYLP